MFPFLASFDDAMTRAHLARVREALRHADLSQEKAAIWMGMQKAHLSDALAGGRPLSLTKLMKLPAEFWQWYGLLVVEDVGLPTVVRRAALMRVALAGRKRMARMAVAVTAERKRA